MTDVNSLNDKVQSLESENGSLKAVIEQLSAEKQALDQTVTEILRANIALKAGCSILEKRLGKLMTEIAAKDEQIKSLVITPCEKDISE